MKKHILTAVLVFIGSFILGYAIIAALGPELEGEELSYMESPSFWKLIGQNSLVCLILITGFGIITVPVGFIQGLVPGITLGIWLSAGYGAGSYVLLTLPHGIFEIPALIISMALGMKFFRVFKNRKKSPQSLKEVLYSIRYYLIVDAALLAAAALTETFVTGWLFSKIML